jgi:tetratricopeptide (TPR) repeat protein
MDINQQPTLQSPTNLRKESVEDDPLSMFLDDDNVDDRSSNNTTGTSSLGLNQLPGPSLPPAIPPRPPDLSIASINLNAKKNFPPNSKYNNLGSQNNNFEAINPNLLHGSPRRRTASQPPVTTNIRANEQQRASATESPKGNRVTSASDTSFNYNNGMIDSFNPLTKFLNGCVEKPLVAPQSSDSFEDIIKLYQRGSYLKCIESAKKLLDPENADVVDPAEVHSERWVNLNFLKLLSYVKLNLKDEALKIIETIGVIDQYLYRRTSGGNNDVDDGGSTIPFALRIEIVKLTNGSNSTKFTSTAKKSNAHVNEQNTADRLRGILALLDSGRVSVLGENGVRKLKSLGLKQNEILDLRLKLYETIISKLLKCEQYGAAKKLINDVLESTTVSPDDNNNVSDSIFGLTSKNRLLFTLSAARVYMHMGDLSSAKRLYDKGKAMANSDVISTNDVDLVQARLGLNWGLLLFSKSKLEEAIKIFSEVIDRCRNEDININNENCKEWIELMVTSANNLAVCALMGGDPTHAVKVIELTLQHSMYCNMNVQLIRNLNILYSLLYSPKTAKIKKQVIVDAAKKYGIDLQTNRKLMI